MRIRWEGAGRGSGDGGLGKVNKYNQLFMNNLEKMKLIDLIGRKLQSEMTYKEIDGYFSQFWIRIDLQPSFNSKWVYVKEILPTVDSDIVTQIWEELWLIESWGIDSFDAIPNFWKPGYFKLFLSHISSYKVKASALKLSLEKYCISWFVAHEDIEPTKDWEYEIEKWLFTMDALCALLIEGFDTSNWTDQEVGAAIGQKKLVIPIIRDLNPYGFIWKYQGFRAKQKTIVEVADAIFKIVATNPKTKNIYTNIF